MPLADLDHDYPVWISLGEYASENGSQYDEWESGDSKPAPGARPFGFAHAHAACPHCLSGEVSGNGTCSLCGIDVRSRLLDSVEELDLGGSTEESQPRVLLKTLDRARRNGRVLLRVEHGSDQGETVRQMGWVLMDRGEIRNWVIGEVLGDRVPVGSEFAKQAPIVRWSTDWNAGNSAVTWFLTA